MITARRFANRNARTIPEVLRLVAGVNSCMEPHGADDRHARLRREPFTSASLLLSTAAVKRVGQGRVPAAPQSRFLRHSEHQAARGHPWPRVAPTARMRTGASSTSLRSRRGPAGGKVDGLGGSRETGSVGTYYGPASATRRFSFGKVTHSQFPMVFWATERLQRQGLGYFREGIETRAASLLYRHDDSVDGLRRRSAGDRFPPGAVFRSSTRLARAWIFSR